MSAASPRGRGRSDARTSSNSSNWEIWARWGLPTVSSPLPSSCFTVNSLHVRTLVLTDVETPFLGTPLVPLNGQCLPGHRVSDPAFSYLPYLPFQPILWNKCFPSESVKSAQHSPKSIWEGGRIWQVCHRVSDPAFSEDRGIPRLAAPEALRGRLHDVSDGLYYTGTQPDGYLVFFLQAVLGYVWFLWSS